MSDQNVDTSLEDNVVNGQLHVTVPRSNPVIKMDAITELSNMGMTPEEAAPLGPGSNDYVDIQEALKQGYSRQEIAAFLQKRDNISIDDADVKVINSVQAKIKEAQAAGYNPAEIKDFLITQHMDGSIIDSAMKTVDVPKPWKKYEWDPNTKAENAQDIADLYKNVYGKYSTFGKQIGGMFDEQMGIEARREINQLNISIADKLVKSGIDAYINPDSGEVMMKNEQGIEQEVDSSFLNDFYNGKTEIAGAMVGGYAGFKIGMRAPGRAKFYAAPVASVAGSALGASIGKAADMTINAAILKEDLSAELYRKQMQEAAIFDGIANVVGTSVFKMSAAGGRSVMRAYDYFLAGNSKGAYKALLDNMQISHEQAQEIVKQWETFNQVKAPGKTVEDKAIAVIASTQQGGESFVKYSASKDPRLANVIISDIDQRAKGLTNAMDNIADPNVGAAVRKDLQAYQEDVKAFYGTIKKEAADAIDGTDFRFDFDKLAIEPVMKNIGKTITDPRIQENYVLHMSRIQNASADRTFGGLLELRTAVNDFKYSKSGMSKADLEAVNAALNRIDSQINKAVKEYMPDTGKAWLNNFHRAKVEYAKMKIFEQNALFKLVTSKKATEESIQKALSKYGNEKDVDMEVFNPVIAKLSGATKEKVEVAAIKNLTNKYTLGEAADKQAIHFPALADTLKELNISSPDGKRLVATIDEMAKIFKNDVNLSRISGNIAVPKFNSYLTTDPVARVKFEMATGIFNMIKRNLPGEQGRNLALLNKIDKLLKDPLHARTADDFLKSVPKEQRAEMFSLMQQLQIETAKAPKPKQADWGYMFKHTSDGTIRKSKGALGEGIYLVDKVKNPTATGKVVKQEINHSRMATMQDLSNMIGKEVTEKDYAKVPDTMKKQINNMLIEKGFLGIKTEGKVMLFPETTPKNK